MPLRLFSIFPPQFRCTLYSSSLDKLLAWHLFKCVYASRALCSGMYIVEHERVVGFCQTFCWRRTRNIKYSSPPLLLSGRRHGCI